MGLGIALGQFIAVLGNLLENLVQTRAHSIIARRRIMIKKVKTNVIT